MKNSIRTRIVKIGNSRGIRIPKLLLDRMALGDEIEIEAQGDHLAIRPAKNPRQGWSEQFAKMTEQGDDQMVDPEVASLTKWDETDWEW